MQNSTILLINLAVESATLFALAISGERIIL